MKKRKLRVLLVETANTNLGDNVIADNHCKLIRYAVFPQKAEIFRYNIGSRDVEQIRYVDAVIFAGAIIKTETEKLWLYVPEILDSAQRYGVPVFLSCIGAEPPEADERGQNLIRAMNLPCVKVISCRDDIDCLKRDYLQAQSNSEVFEVFDSALWSADTYKEVLRTSAYKKEKNTIGLGIIRHAIFPDYGHPEISKEQQIEFWCSAIEKIEQSGYQWKLFTNGATGDEAFARELIALLGRGEKLPPPADANALVRYINAFGGVIAGRMHSNIIAYALGVPSVGFIWNKKLRFWGEKIGHPERFLEPEALDGRVAAEKLFACMEKPDKALLKQKMPTLKAFKKFFKYVQRRDITAQNVLFKGKLCAMSLGVKDRRYRNTNSPAAFAYSLQNGYENFHADVRLSADKKPVLIKRWNAEAYAKMSLPVPEGKVAPMRSEAFLAARYYNRFKPYTLKGFLKDVTKKEGIKNIFFSFGRPAPAALEKILRTIGESAHGAQARFIFCFEQKQDIELFHSLGIPGDVMYHENQGEEISTVLEYCRENNIAYLRLRAERFDKQVQALCESYGVKTFVFKCEKVQDIVGALQSGADFVSTGLYDADYLERLVNIG